MMLITGIKNNMSTIGKGPDKFRRAMSSNIVLKGELDVDSLEQDPLSHLVRVLVPAPLVLHIATIW